MKIIDALGKPCPLPVIEAKKAMQALGEAGGELQVLVDNDVARQNIEKMVKKLDYSVCYETQADGNIAVQITVPPAAERRAQSAAEGSTTVVFSSRYMGRGEDELGAILMKSYIYSLTELDKAPEHLIFFNSGVYLTCEGSTALDDLRTLHEKGSQISSCGACLDYYQIKDSLAVGEVSNMYGIASLMAQADKLINL